MSCYFAILDYRERGLLYISASELRFGAQFKKIIGVKVRIIFIGLN
jgi:hypothetical protein